MDTSAYLLARNQTLDRDPLMIRLRAEYAAKELGQLEAEIAEEASRFAPAPGGWPAPTGCDCAECQGFASRGVLDGLPRQEITRTW